MVNTIETADSTEKVRNGNPVVKNETEYTKENYPSAVYLLSVLQSEYNYEADRLSRLDTRSGVFIALLGALLVFLLDKLNIKQILSIQQISLLEAIPHVLMIIFSIVSLASIMYSIYPEFRKPV
ncbi:hypothetical protein ABDI30_20155, partial [Paenibacillus cisolokensis]|uniref:hypothetical protein n=1 Tax=Paenibacillus cisolokensis TaxID=1658519 RepID=UPI003D2764D4